MRDTLDQVLSIFFKSYKEFLLRDNAHPLNERVVEYSYSLREIWKAKPTWILDVGSGSSPFPSLLAHCGFRVDAIDPNARAMNRHYPVKRQDILHHKISREYDVVTCISTLEHIPQQKLAVENMLRLLTKHGILILTFPYREDHYVPNAYALPNSTYGHVTEYITQIFSRETINSWDIRIINQEYYRCWRGDFWAQGMRFHLPVSSTRDAKHDLTCLTAVRGTF